MTPEELKAWENTIWSFVCQGVVAIIIITVAIRIAIDIFKGRN